MNSVSLWGGNIEQPNLLPHLLLELYQFIGLAEQDPEPEVVTEGEPVHVNELLEPLSLSEQFVDLAVPSADAVGLRHANTLVAVYSYERPRELQAPPGSALRFIGS